MTWLWHFLGIDNASGNAYLAWSGFGSDIGEFAILGALVAHYKRHTCHVDSPRFCWRPGTHPVAGTPFRVCRVHHPAVPGQITADHIADAHAEQAAGEGRARRLLHRGDKTSDMDVDG